MSKVLTADYPTATNPLLYDNCTASVYAAANAIEDAAMVACDMRDAHLVYRLIGTQRRLQQLARSIDRYQK